MRSSNARVTSMAPILGPGRSAPSGRGAKLDMGVVLEGLADGALDLAQGGRFGGGRLDQGLGEGLDHEAVRFLGEGEGSRLAAGADDAAGGAGEARQVFGLP